MNASRIARLEQGLTSIARKVLEVVPIAEPWPSSSIMAVLKRNGQNIAQPVLDGVLQSLKDDGLVRERLGMFQRVYKAPEDDSSDAGDEPATAPGAVVKIAPAPDLLTRWGSIAGRLRALADDIDAAALESAEQFERADADGEQLRKLRALLKGIAE